MLTKEDLQMKKVLQDKIDGHLANKESHIANVLQAIQKEGHALTDYLAGSAKITYAPVRTEGATGDFLAGSPKINTLPSEPGGLVESITMNFNNQVFDIHKHALGQMAAKMNIPAKYLRNLVEGDQWQRWLALNILNEHMSHAEKRYLVRTVEGNVKGFLSDSYRRYDSLDIYRAFIEGMHVNNGAIVNALNGETKSFLEAIQPEVRHIETPNNGIVFLTFGAQIRNSDYGSSMLEVRNYTMQPVCLNGMTRQSVISQMHLGSVLPENIELAEDTMKSQTETMKLQVRDAIRGMFSEQAINAEVLKIQEASNDLIENVDKTIEKLPKQHINDEEKDSLANIFMSRRKEDGVIGKPTRWSLAQGVAAVARNSENGERSRELMEFAGSILN